MCIRRLLVLLLDATALEATTAAKAATAAAAITTTAGAKETGGDEESGPGAPEEAEAVLADGGIATSILEVVLGDDKGGAEAVTLV